MKNIVFLTGAGISAESGLKTFRDENGLWEGNDVTKVASIEGFKENPRLVLDFYNQRRKQLLTVHPNKAHEIITEFQSIYNVEIITQNVDDLHERAGNKNVLHLHGELLKARSLENENLIYDWKNDINLGTTNDQGHQLRPHIVWFGEAVPEMENAIKIVKNADILIIVGTSLQVYPAASLIDFTKTNTEIYYIDQNPAVVKHFNRKITVIAKKATDGMIDLMAILTKS